VIFGSVPSPYILDATRTKHLNQYKEKYPETVKQLMQNTYVHDVQCVADDEKLLFSFKEERTKIMAEGGFTLHKWHSNILALQSTGDDQQKMLEETSKHQLEQMVTRLKFLEYSGINQWTP